MSKVLTRKKSETNSMHIWSLYQLSLAHKINKSRPSNAVKLQTKPRESQHNPSQTTALLASGLIFLNHIYGNLIIATNSSTIINEQRAKEMMRFTCSTKDGRYISAFHEYLIQRIW